MNFPDFKKLDPRMLKIGALAGGALFLAVLLLFTLPEMGVHRTIAPEVEYVPEGNLKAFYRDCVTQVAKGGEVPTGCRSYQAMEAAYGVNADFLLKRDHGKMVMTARRIARGELATPADLKACIRRGECHEIPMIPPKYHNNEKALNSPQGIKTREAFWHLVNDGRITVETCAYLDICKAFYRIGLVRFDEQERRL